MTARQSHGFQFEAYMKNHLGIDKGKSFDIPPYPNCYNNEGISIKCIGEGGSISLGSAKIQYRIQDDFYFIVSFYNKSKNKIEIIWLKEIYVTKEEWRELWGDIEEQDILKLEGLITDKSKRKLSKPELNDFRIYIKKEKGKILQNKVSIIKLHQKIDSGTQRRLQCSIPNKRFFEFFGIDKRQMGETNIGGKNIILKDILLY